MHIEVHYNAPILNKNILVKIHRTTASTGLADKVPASRSCAMCQAWHRTSRVKILTPGNRGAEGWQKGKGVVARRTRGRHIKRVIEEVRRYMMGWRPYFGFAEVWSLFKELDSWVKRRLRCYQWKQWKRRGYREWVKQGVSRDLTWNTFKSAYGPWRLSRSPGLAFALTAHKK